MNENGIRDARGYALPVVLIASFLAATITAAFIFKARSSSEAAADLLRQRQTFYAADGMSRMVVKEVESYLMETLNPSTLDLQDPANIPPPSLKGYQVEKYEIITDLPAFDGPIPSGIFEGLHARQTPFDVNLVARHTASNAASRVSLQVMLGQIGLFQFFLFSDDYTELYPGANMTIPEGRIHINGDLCISSGSNLKVDRVTAAGRILPGIEGCRRVSKNKVYISDGSSHKELNKDNAWGCTDCGGTSLSWSAYASSRWKGHLRDKSHGVIPLRLPITTSPLVQAGLDADGNLMTNNKNSRTLIDPVRATDGSDVLEQKFAAQADLRIINGVWYINNGTWPGKPIWSDHPGTFVIDPSALLTEPLGLLPTWAFDAALGAAEEIIDDTLDTVDDTVDGLLTGLGSSTTQKSATSGNGDGNSGNGNGNGGSTEAEEGEDGEVKVDVAPATGPLGDWGYWGPLPVGVGSEGPESWAVDACERVLPGNSGEGNANGLNKLCKSLPTGYVPPPAGALLVGQGDLAVALGWERIPRRFSHYDWDPTTQDLVADGMGSVSYGTLFKADDDRWRPGYWAAGPGTATYADALGIPNPYFCDRCEGALCYASLALRDASVPFCQGSENGVYTESVGAQYLQGARAGIIDYRIENGDSGKGKLLPINFDIEQFTLAMQDTTPGELGSYFNGGATFNGVIFISASWPGAMDGLPDGLATLWPTQGAAYDESQAPARGTPMAQAALPHTLCSHTKGVIPGVQRVRHSGPAADLDLSDGHETWFSIPSCDPAVAEAAYPNAVRVINADVVDEAVFPIGLSIVSNIPAYALGNANISSDSAEFEAEPWVPFMIGADALTLLSRNWDDKNAPWDKSVSYSKRNAVNTQYNLEFIGGLVQTVDGNHYSGGVENFPRFLENWSGKNATIRGSLVIGFNSVYARQPWGSGNVYSAPNRDWAYDPHLRVLNNQPPGTPRYSVHSVSRMERL